MHSCSVHQLTDVLDSPRRRDRCHELSSAAAVFAPESSRGHRGPLLCSDFPFATLGVRTRHVSGASVTVPVRARSGSPREVKDCNQRASTVLTTLRQTMSTSSVYCIRQHFKAWPKITLCCLQVQIPRRSNKFASGCWLGFCQRGSNLRLYSLFCGIPGDTGVRIRKEGEKRLPCVPFVFFQIGDSVSIPGLGNATTWNYSPSQTHSLCKVRGNKSSSRKASLAYAYFWLQSTIDSTSIRLSTQPKSDYIEVVDRWVLKRIPIGGRWFSQYQLKPQ